MPSERLPSLRPRCSRCQLQWVVFVPEGERRWTLVLPHYYAGLFELSFPSLVKKAAKGFRDSSTGKTKIARFVDLDDGDLRRIRAFIEWYQHAVCVSINKHIADHFAGELDFWPCT